MVIAGCYRVVVVVNAVGIDHGHHQHVVPFLVQLWRSSHVDPVLVPQCLGLGPVFSTRIAEGCRRVGNCGCGCQKVVTHCNGCQLAGPDPALLTFAQTRQDACVTVHGDLHGIVRAALTVR